MGILSTLERRNLGPADDYWYMPATAPSGGAKASPDQAMGLSAWYNGINIISGTLGSLPLKLYRRVGESREPARDDPRYWMLFREPNEWQTAFEWREMAQGHVLARGNHFSRILRDAIGRPAALVPLHPDRVEIEVNGGVVSYLFRDSNGRPVPIARKDMLHLRGLSGDGLSGYSVANIAAESLGYGLQLEKHGSALMGNKARPGGVLQTDQVLQKETKSQLGSQWDSQFTGGGLGATAVLDAGLKWQQVGFSAEDAQFLQSRKHQVTEVARWLNLPPHFLKDLERSTFSNIEHQALEFVVHTIRPWAERWEQRLDQTFIQPEERGQLFFKFSLDALLRGDSAARAAFYTSLFQMAALSPNEIRALEDMNPVDGGDERFVQLNLVPLSQASDPIVGMDENAARSVEPLERTQPLVPEVEQRSVRPLRARRHMMETYRKLLEDVAGRMVQREVRDLQRCISAAGGDTDEFLRRVDVFAGGLPNTVRSIMGPTLTSYISLVADAAAEEVGMDGAPTGLVERFASDHIEALADGHTSETVGELRAATEEDEPLARLAEVLDRWEHDRARSIALREVVASAAGAARVVYAEAGLLQFRWQAYDGEHGEVEPGRDHED